MTQKELLYIEDAISHEQNIISYLDNFLSILETEEIMSFFEDEIKHHDDILKKLNNKLEGESNEWSGNNI